MVKVIFVKNPFSPARDRVIKLSEAADRPLNFYTEEFTQQLPNQEAWIQIDGRKVDAVVEDISKLPVKHDSVIVVMPKVAKGGKSILGLIAVIACGYGRRQHHCRWCVFGWRCYMDSCILHRRCSRYVFRQQPGQQIFCS